MGGKGGCGVTHEAQTTEGILNINIYIASIKKNINK